MSTITFLIPIKSLKFTNNLKNFIKILDRTLSALVKIENSNTIIVCNTLPKNYLVPDNTKIITVPDLNLGYGDSDKEYKVYVGSKYWLSTSVVKHLMILDMDDIVLPAISSITLEDDVNIAMNSGFQKIFNRGFLYKNNFFLHCGSSFIFSRYYISEKVKEYSYGSSWMFHQSHILSNFKFNKIPCILQVPWNGENIYWKKPKFRDFIKWFFSKKINYTR